jgi:hypothetical protein
VPAAASAGKPPAVRRTGPGHGAAHWDDRRARLPIDDRVISAASSTTLE